jgi:GNAT superfamily N-acetyltransferase
MIEKFTFRRLEIDSDCKTFDCSDPDLNDFFLTDSKDYLKQLLAVTYVFEDENNTVTFFSVLNDKISSVDIPKSVFRKIKQKMPHKKHLKSYPAVKVGRFGVHIKYQRKKIGTEVMDFIKAFFTKRNKTGCRFITIDAYNNPAAIGFYSKNGFQFLTPKDEKDDTRLMYFDLMTFVRNHRS